MSSLQFPAAAAGWSSQDETSALTWKSSSELEHADAHCFLKKVFLQHGMHWWISIEEKKCDCDLNWGAYMEWFSTLVMNCELYAWIDHQKSADCESVLGQGGDQSAINWGFVGSVKKQEGIEEEEAGCWGWNVQMVDLRILLWQIGDDGVTMRSSAPPWKMQPSPTFAAAILLLIINHAHPQFTR